MDSASKQQVPKSKEKQYDVEKIAQVVKKKMNETVLRKEAERLKQI